MRLIDADALEELFREVIGGIAKRPEINGNLEHMIRASAVVVEMIKDAPTIEPEPHWIPCSERLPDNDESVLISNCHGVTKAWWNGKFWTSIAVKKYMTVTAWMPLPEPYQPKEE